MTLASRDSYFPIFIFEPSISHHYDFDIRHWRFIYQSIMDMKQQGLNLNLFYGEAIDVFRYLFENLDIKTIFSHEESGNNLTYERDKDLKVFFRNQNVEWRESQTNMVIRGLRNRDGWDARWIKTAKGKALPIPDIKKAQELINHPFQLPSEVKESLSSRTESIDSGGERVAHVILEDFYKTKIEDYWFSLSYPEKSRYYCSRLSSHITYGNLTIRQVYQVGESFKPIVKNRKSLNQYLARLKWHCHFVQKFEMEPRIEFENLSKAFNSIRQKTNKTYVKAWKNGKTGYPLIDAAMRSVAETGYLNFRLRATVVSFLTHILWQPWQSGSGHLARMFVDYEPGIHFSQFQMQAGTTGINAIRIYNPIKQSKEKDKDGIFIKKWVPELSSLPSELIHEPWKLSEMEQLLYDFKLGSDYPRPIVKFEEAYKNAQKKLWEVKKSEENKYNAQSILKKHTRRKRRA